MFEVNASDLASWPKPPENGLTAAASRRALLGRLRRAVAAPPDDVDFRGVVGSDGVQNGDAADAGPHALRRPGSHETSSDASAAFPPAAPAGAST